ncbi:MAG: ribonuclease J [Clostridia bacterium]|nr:ribonuclease J [Clostridia bacterium]
MARTKTPKVKIIPLGGVDGIGKNMTVIECGDDIIVIDCGIAFPEDDMLGIDYVIPDISYLEENRDKVKALIITHGHEDHIGAIPFFLKLLNVPVYGTKLTLGIIENKLIEHGILNVSDLRVVNAGDTVSVGAFDIEFIRVNHSIADSVALSVNTPQGIIVISGDFKIDYTPIDGDPINLGRFAELGNNGVRVFMCDSTNVQRPGFTPSEKIVGQTIDRLMNGLKKRVIIATFSSNVHRVQQIIDASVKNKRKVAVTGRSMQNIMKAAIRLGYMNVPDGALIELSEMKQYKPEQLTLITTGSQGEPMSALYRMAFGEHSAVTLGKDDMVILSSSSIPGNEKLISKIVNELVKRGVTVYNDDVVSDVHVSGHACREELKMMHSLIKAEYFIPMHGEYKHLASHIELAKLLGRPDNRCIFPETGKVIEMDKRGVRSAETVKSGQIFVDGYGVGDVGTVVLKERKQLGEDGIIIIAASVDFEREAIVAGPEIITRGFVHVREAEPLLEKLRKIAEKTLNKCINGGYIDVDLIKACLKDDISSFIIGQTKRRPAVLPIIMETMV